VLQITDTASMFNSSALDSVLARFTPHPKGFNLIWAKQVGDQHLFVWQPRPPSAGMPLPSLNTQRERGAGGLTREVETPLPSNSPHEHMILRVDLVGSHGRWKRPCLQTAHMTI
jgi:hypothetical protein